MWTLKEFINLKIPKMSPFKSKAQERFAFSTRQPWAKKWAKMTDEKKLPEKIKKKKKK
jgi:hypothetical protein